jgi:hypothetical protein
VRNLLLGAVDHVKLLILEQAHDELIICVLHSAADVLFNEVGLFVLDDKFESPVRDVAVNFDEVHAVVTTEAELVVLGAGSAEQI